jgi:hypothetical protein
MAIILDADVIIRGEKGVFDLMGWVASRPGRSAYDNLTAAVRRVLLRGRARV